MKLTLPYLTLPYLTLPRLRRSLRGFFRAASVACAISRLLAVSALSLSFASQAALVGRDLDGNAATFEAVYDDVLNITWLADANLAASNTFGVSGINANGSMNWNTAESFAAAMNADDSGAGYLGVNTWRQSTVSPVGGGSVFDTSVTYDGSSDRGFQLSAPVDANNQSGQSAGFTGAELAYHYYNNLGGIGVCSGVGGSDTYGCVSSSIYGVDDATNTANLALFSNLQNSTYWAGTELASGSPSAFAFNAGSGGQGTVNKTVDIYYVWAVAAGDVGASTVPVPAAAWLFGSALLGLAGLKRRS